MQKLIYLAILIFGFVSCHRWDNYNYCATCRNVSITNNDSVVSQANACSSKSIQAAEEEARRKLPQDSNTVTKCEITIAE